VTSQPRESGDDEDASRKLDPVRTRRSKSSRYFCDKRLDCLRLTSIDLYDLLLDSVELRRGICSTDSDCPSINKNRKNKVANLLDLVLRSSIYLERVAGVQS